MGNGKFLLLILCVISTVLNAQKLDLSNQELSQIPDSVWLMKDLKELDLSGNDIVEIPANIEALKSLVSINLKGNPIKLLPIEAYKLPIRVWNVSNTPLFRSETFYSNLKMKNSLLVIENEKLIPEYLASTKAIRHLKLKDVSLLDSNVIRYPNIYSLEIIGGEIFLDKIAPSFPHLKAFKYAGSGTFNLNLKPLNNLRSLCLSGVKVDFGYLKNQGANLHTIRLMDAGLKEIPKQLTTLKKLRVLDLSDNEIQDFRITAPEFKKLKLLNIKGNEISSKELNRIYRNTDAVIYHDDIKEAIPEIAPEYARKFKKITLSSSDSVELNVDKGLKIRIPNNAFLTPSGEPYEGPIEVKYKSFNDPIDFVFSGIPMSHQSGNEGHYFESLKMFELRVFDNSQNELQLRSGSPIKANFSSANAANYKGWQLDTNSGKWNEVPMALRKEVTIKGDRDNTKDLSAPYRRPQKGDFEYLPRIPIAPEYNDYTKHQKVYTNYSVWEKDYKKDYAVYFAGKIDKNSKSNPWFKPLYDLRAIHQVDWRLYSENEYKRVKSFCDKENIIMFKISREEDHCIVKLDGSRSSIQFNAIPVKEDRSNYNEEDIDKLLKKINDQVGLRVDKWKEVDAYGLNQNKKYKRWLKVYEEKTKAYNEDKEEKQKAFDAKYEAKLKTYNEKVKAWNEMPEEKKLARKRLRKTVDFFREIEVELGYGNLDKKVDYLIPPIAINVPPILPPNLRRRPRVVVEIETYFLVDKKKNSVVKFEDRMPRIKEANGKRLLVKYDNGSFGYTNSRRLSKYVRGKNLQSKVFKPWEKDLDSLKKMALK